MEKLGDALGTLINALPPMVGAVLVIAVVFVALVYLWRQAGRDAAKEKAQQDTLQKWTVLLICNVYCQYNKPKPNDKSHSQFSLDETFGNILLNILKVKVFYFSTFHQEVYCSFPS